MNILRTLFIGIAIGMANVIPGVSGGTLAVVFNIYDKFINAITFNVKKIIQNWRFVVPLIGGMALGVLIFSKLISILYTKFPVQTNFFFVGLIFGSIPLLFSLMIKKSENEKFGAGRIISIVLCALVGFALLVFFSRLEQSFDKSQIIGSMPKPTLPLLIKIFTAGVLGAVAMIIPGISGSLIMLIMGVYPIIMYCIPALFNFSETLQAITLLVPNGIGVVLGLVFGAGFVRFLLKKVPNNTYAVIFGLLCGSVVPIFPGFSAIKGAVMWISCILCFAAGGSLAYFSSKFAPNEENKENA